MRPLSSAAPPLSQRSTDVCLFIQYMKKKKTRKINSICKSSATDIQYTCIGCHIRHPAFPMQLARTATAHCERAPYKYRTRDNGRSIWFFFYIIILVIMLANLLIYGYWFTHKCSAHTRHTHQSPSFDIGATKNRRLFCIGIQHGYTEMVSCYFAWARQPDE